MIKCIVIDKNFFTRFNVTKSIMYNITCGCFSFDNCIGTPIQGLEVWIAKAYIGNFRTTTTTTTVTMNTKKRESDDATTKEVGQAVTKLSLNQPPTKKKKRIQPTLLTTVN
mmetsp:Transcript_29499/g.41292  ORF Transcript_29499/g.41292 Transcript_29499/m.41292 type:complete len:111 (+) Transcript_29499:222-554(+)